MENCKIISECLACGNDKLSIILNLGHQPLANNFSKDLENNEIYPLAINQCTNCFHLQLTHVVDPGIIYQNYSYVSGTSQTYLDYMWWFAKWTREYTGTQFGSVLDIGCNDGSQLDFYKKLGYLTYGVDPAKNLHKTSTDKGHQVVCGFWNEQSIGNLDNRQFDIVVAQNSFAHNPDPLSYLTKLQPLMKPNGLFFIQTSQADMVSNGEFDTIYHEHVNFYNINSMNELCKRSGWYLLDVIKTPIHGTSYVFVLGLAKNRPEHVKNLIAMESFLLDNNTYKTWTNGASKIANEFSARLQLFRDHGYKIIGYGAAAKGMTLLNFANSQLDCIIDDNPIKQGCYSPGQKIPVVSIDHLNNFSSTDKILFVPLAWNFFTEIKNKILQKRNNSNDKFLRYFPEVEVGV
jgi:SAM-dependent methyltransferase